MHRPTAPSQKKGTQKKARERIGAGERCDTCGEFQNSGDQGVDWLALHRERSGKEMYDGSGQSGDGEDVQGDGEEKEKRADIQQGVKGICDCPSKRCRKRDSLKYRV